MSNSAQIIRLQLLRMRHRLNRVHLTKQEKEVLLKIGIKLKTKQQYVRAQDETCELANDLDYNEVQNLLLLQCKIIFPKTPDEYSMLVLPKGWKSEINFKYRSDDLKGTPGHSIWQRIFDNHGVLRGYVEDFRSQWSQSKPDRSHVRLTLVPRFCIEIFGKNEMYPLVAAIDRASQSDIVASVVVFEKADIDKYVSRIEEWLDANLPGYDHPVHSWGLKVEKKNDE